MKVVMVDNSREDRELCRLLLGKRYGSQLQFFGEGIGAKGLEICRTIGPDCVLLDYTLPDMDGVEFLTRLRSADAAGEPRFAVVVLTGSGSEQAALDAIKAGAQDYVVKEFVTAQGLSLAVEKAIEKIGVICAVKAERDRLARLLAEKEVLLKEVHHRVKNNLQVIASLLSLQADAPGEERFALRDSQRRVESMALIHEQLYETGNLHEIDLAKSASLLVANLLQSYGVERARIASRVTLGPLPLGVDQAIPAGLILNELVSNALKHAFPEGDTGLVSVGGGLRGDCVVLEVSDNGTGIPPVLDLKKTKSLGLKIVKILTRQLKGTLELDRRRGTTFRVSFPEQHGRHEILQSAGSGR
jgi:two-component sensor histidine kinase